VSNSRGARFPSRSAPHRSSWEPGPSTAAGAGIAITASSAQLGGTIASALVDSQTLIRTRGELLLFLRLATNSADGFVGAFGIAKATTAAALAGAASVPTPLTEDTWDGWLYHTYFALLTGGPIAAATAAQETDQVNNVVAALRIAVDSKAMRKIDADESFYAAIEVTEVGTAEMTWAFQSRLLVKDMS